MTWLKRFVIVLGFAVFLAACTGTVSNSHYSAADLTYTVTGSGGLTTADIEYLDGSGSKVILSSVSLPATYNFPSYSYSAPWVWAQNITPSDFSDTLTVTITTNAPNGFVPSSSGSASGLNCIAQTSYKINFY